MTTVEHVRFLVRSGRYFGTVPTDFCAYCGVRLHEQNRTLDHVVPKSHGGGRGLNLVEACKPCNMLKASIPLLAFLIERRRFAALRLATVGRKALYRFAPCVVVDVEPATTFDRWTHRATVRFLGGHGRTRTVWLDDLWLVPVGDEDLPISELRTRCLQALRDAGRIRPSRIDRTPEKERPP